MCRALIVVLLSVFASTPHTAGAATLPDYVFADGFDPVYAIALAAPIGPPYLYTAQVTVGDQEFALLVDTGSTTLAVAGMTCTAGCTGVSPLYAPSASATATGQTASTTYGDGSGWLGSVFSDSVGLGNGSPSVPLDLVEITHATGSFFDGSNDYQGILGLGQQLLAAPNTTGYVPALANAGLDNILAFDLCDNTGANAGTMWVGGAGTPASVQYTPLVPISDTNPFYSINVDALSLGNTSVVSNASSTFQKPVLDTGTELFYVPSAVYTKFEATLAESAGYKALFGTSSLTSGCVTGAGVTDAQVESDLPPIVLSLPNVTSGQPDVTIQASALDTYLYNAGGGQYCLAIQDGGTVDPSTFGAAFMQAFHIVIDVTNGRVGLASPTTCVAAAVARPIRHPEEKGPHRAPRSPAPPAE